LVESRNRSGLEELEKISGEVMGNVVPILIGGGLEQGHSCVDETNNGVNVFTSMVLDLQVLNLEEQEVQCGLRTILGTM